MLTYQENIYIDNLDALIYWYNRESDEQESCNQKSDNQESYNQESDERTQNNVLDYINKHGLKILDKYKKYFNSDDKEKYNECF